MTTTIGAPGDEVVLHDESAEAVPVRPTGPLPSIRGRRVGLMLGSLALSLAATAIARRITAQRRMPTRRLGRRALVNLLPRVAVIAPTMTINLPFSAIPSTGTRGGFRSRRPFAWRGRQQQTSSRAWRLVRFGRYAHR